MDKEGIKEILDCISSWAWNQTDKDLNEAEKAAWYQIVEITDPHHMPPRKDHDQDYLDEVVTKLQKCATDNNDKPPFQDALDYLKCLIKEYSSMELYDIEKYKIGAIDYIKWAINDIKSGIVRYTNASMECQDDNWLDEMNYALQLIGDLEASADCIADLFVGDNRESE